MKSYCEICNLKLNVEKHHIQSKCFEGSNAKHNICYICPNCHRKVHLGEIILEGKFLTLDGFKLIYHLKGEESITGFNNEVYLINKDDR